jgi:class 3 adenylate cyclase
MLAEGLTEQAPAGPNQSASGSTRFGTTNVAARLQSYAPEHSVVIGERTYGLVSDVAQVRPLGAASLKGKAAPTKVFELLGM